MRKVRKSTIRRLMGLYVFFTVVLASSFLVMIYTKERTEYLIVSSVFWAGIVFGSLFLILTLVKYKKWYKQEHGDEIPKKRLPGVFRFFTSTRATIADGVFLASTISFIVLRFTKHSEANIVFILLFLMIVSFSLHSILNGNIYNEIKKHKTKGAKKS